MSQHNLFALVFFFLTFPAGWRKSDNFVYRCSVLEQSSRENDTYWCWCDWCWIGKFIYAICAGLKYNNTGNLFAIWTGVLQPDISLIHYAHSWDIKLDTRREIPYLCTLMCYSLVSVLLSKFNVNQNFNMVCHLISMLSHSSDKVDFLQPSSTVEKCYAHISIQGIYFKQRKL